MRRRWKFVSGLALLLCVAAGRTHPVMAQDFFSNLFGAFGARPPSRTVLPFANDGPPSMEAPRARRAYGGGHTAWCVRTCDGRYFPITGTDTQTRTASCNNLCPASKTELVYGNDIDHAATTGGKAYSELPNAFKYRNELVAGCTCNGKDPAGLASVSAEKDPTLRKGDIVAGADGLMIADPASGKHAEVNFTPAPASLRMRFHRAPVVARE